MNLTLTYDHRLIDGLAGRFLRDLREKLQTWGEDRYARACTLKAPRNVALRARGCRRTRRRSFALAPDRVGGARRSSSRRRHMCRDSAVAAPTSQPSWRSSRVVEQASFGDRRPDAAGQRMWAIGCVAYLPAITSGLPRSFVAITNAPVDSCVGRREPSRGGNEHLVGREQEPVEAHVRWAPRVAGRNGRGGASTGRRTAAPRRRARRRLRPGRPESRGRTAR